MAVTKKPTWRDIKQILVKEDSSELLKLIADLYSLNAANKSFLNSRYNIAGERLEPYKSIISESLYPDIYKNKPLSLSKGRKAISDYFKATKDKKGQIELMVHYLESGNNFTAEFGDIDEQFYSSLESMFERIITELKKQPSDIQEKYLKRLEEVVRVGSGIGWGYSDYISDIYYEYEEYLKQ